MYTSHSWCFSARHVVYGRRKVLKLVLDSNAIAIRSRVLVDRLFVCNVQVMGIWAPMTAGG